MDFDRIREDILKGKDYLHFTADRLMVYLCMLNLAVQALSPVLLN